MSEFCECLAVFMIDGVAHDPIDQMPAVIILSETFHRLKGARGGAGVGQVAVCCWAIGIPERVARGRRLQVMGRDALIPSRQTLYLSPG